MSSQPGSPVWSSHPEPLTNGRTLRFRINRGASPVSFAEVLARWQGDADFRAFFSGLLGAAPFTAFRWETPPVSTATVDRPFEFVLLDSPGLAQQPDARAFAEHFRGAAGARVVTFPNLGGDAVLVVPCPEGPPSAYGHLAAFLRHAPESQRHELWTAVGQAMQRELNPDPLWLSTAGAGVSWLHVRLDRRPKYYGHGPYRPFAAP